MRVRPFTDIADDRSLHDDDGAQESLHADRDAVRHPHDDVPVQSRHSPAHRGFVCSAEPGLRGASGYAAPTTSSGKKFTGTCAGDATKISDFIRAIRTFFRCCSVRPPALLDSSNNSRGHDGGARLPGACDSAERHAARSERLADGDDRHQRHALLNSFKICPRCRAATTLSSKLPRGQFLHDARLLGRAEHQRQQPTPRDGEPSACSGRSAKGFLNAEDAVITLPTLVAVNGDHASNGACYGCHKAPRSDAAVLGNELRLQRPHGRQRQGRRRTELRLRRRRTGRQNPGRLRQPFLAPGGRRAGGGFAGESLPALAMAQKLCFCRQLVEMARRRIRSSPRRARVPELELRFWKTLVRELVRFTARHGGDRHRRTFDCRTA